jgi:hypothetical protein
LELDSRTPQGPRCEATAAVDVASIARRRLARPGEGGTALFEWYFNGDTPSRYGDRFRLSKPSAEVVDAGIDSGGVRLFDHIGGPVRLETLSVVDAPGVTHLRYRVTEGGISHPTPDS